MDGRAEFNPHVIACSQLRLEDNSAPRTAYPARTVRWYELELILEDDRGGIVVDGEELPTRVGTLFLRKPGMRVQGICAYGCRSMVFDSFYDPVLEEVYAAQSPFGDGPTRALNDYILGHHRNCALLSSLPTVIQLERHEEVAELLREAYSHQLAGGAESAFYVKSILFQVLRMALEQLGAQSRVTPSDCYQRMQQIKNYLEDCYPEPITLEALGRRALMSTGYLCRAFKKAVGVSPVEYLMRVRIASAKHYLTVTNKTVSEIAGLCGFKTEAHFYKTFKQREGLTPSAFRTLGTYQRPEG